MTTLRAGVSRVFTDQGVFLVKSLHHAGAVLTEASGEELTLRWDELIQLSIQGMDGLRLEAMHHSLQERWDALPEAVREVAMARLEVVLTVTTGYRLGFPALALPDEPWPAFDPNHSETQRCEAMASQLSIERSLDRKRRRRLQAGELTRQGPVSVSSIRNWLRAYKAEGVWGLVDRRSLKKAGADFSGLDAVFRDLVDQEVDKFDGDISTVRVDEVLRRVRLAARDQSLNLEIPQRASRRYVGWRLRQRGRGTRAQRTRSMRDTAGYEHYPAMRIGQVVAIDATRADVMVWDELHERAYSVEILTAIDVASRVILAMRVVPKSANALDAALLMYDVMRPFAMHVEGTSVTDWRWAGIPEAVDFGCDHLDGPDEDAGDPDERAAPPCQTHYVPSVMPEAIRCDHGSIFVGTHFTRLLNDLEIDLRLSRGSRPTDNSHIERFHETLQGVLQQLPGYKGRNTFERGRLVGKDRDDGGRDLLTAAELERYLRRWVCLHYHRSWHEGLTLAGAPAARLTPIEMFDTLLDVTGRIDVPQRADLLYQFLPIKWGRVRHDGAEFANLTYDDPILDEFRDVFPGQHGWPDGKAPFFYDPRDVSRLWFRHPTTGAIHPIPWRGAWRLNAPMTDKVLDLARSRIKARGGNKMLNRHTATELILDELGAIDRASLPPADQALMAAASLRVQASRRDHFEAQLAAYSGLRAEVASVIDAHILTTEEPLVPRQLGDEMPELEAAPEPSAAAEGAPQSKAIEMAATWSRMWDTSDGASRNQTGW